MAILYNYNLFNHSRNCNVQSYILVFLPKQNVTLKIVIGIIA